MACASNNAKGPLPRCPLILLGHKTSWGLKLSQISLETDERLPQHIFVYRFRSLQKILKNQTLPTPQHMGPILPIDYSWIPVDCWRFLKLNWGHILVFFVVTHPRVSLVLMIKGQSNRQVMSCIPAFFLAKDMRTMQRQGAFWDELGSEMLQWSSSVRPVIHPSLRVVKYSS